MKYKFWFTHRYNTEKKFPEFFRIFFCLSYFGVFFSKSYTKNSGVIVFSCSEIGIDIEILQKRFDSLWSDWKIDEELIFLGKEITLEYRYQIWTAREAILKYLNQLGEEIFLENTRDISCEILGKNWGVFHYKNKKISVEYFYREKYIICVAKKYEK